MQTKKTKVTLLSATQMIQETIYCEWQHSRVDGFSMTPWEVWDRVRREKAELYVSQIRMQPGSRAEVVLTEDMLRKMEPGSFGQEVRKVFEDCVDMRVPIAETVGFVFLVEHMPISLREQWVRHRIGHKFNGDFGFESIPNQHDSSFWSQTFRAKDMGSFAKDGEYLEPEWLEHNGNHVMEGHGRVICRGCGEEAKFYPGPGGGKYYCSVRSQLSCQANVEVDFKFTVRRFWQEQHGWIAAAYQRLLKVGMPQEDARNVLPLGCQHSMTWSCNLQGLIHILGKRGCWIAQLGMWEPVIRDIVRELTEKVDPYFNRLIDPPCIGKDGNFEQCRFHKENEEYIKGKDPHHPCPLWLYNHGGRAQDAMEAASEPTWTFQKGPDASSPLFDSEGRWWRAARPHVTGTIEAEEADFRARADRYAELWGRDPLTGERKRYA